MKKPKKITIVISAIVLLAIGFSYVVFSGVLTDKNTNKTDLNYTGPSEEEAQAGDRIKDDIVAENNTPPDPESMKNARITIVDASYYKNLRDDASGQPFIEVRAFVGNTVDASGKCKLLLTGGNTTINREAGVNADAQSTWCNTFTIPMTSQEFGAVSEWKIKLSYESNTTTGSLTKTITVVN